MCNSQLFLTHVLFTTKYLQLIFHSTKTQQEASIAIQILWRKKKRGRQNVQSKATVSWFFFCQSYQDSTILSSGCKSKKRFFLNVRESDPWIHHQIENLLNRWWKTTVGGKKTCASFSASIFCGVINHIWTRGHKNEAGNRNNRK